MRNWVVSWTGAVQGPYPIGNANAQPELKFAFPNPERGASNQTFRLIVRPDIWGNEARIRLSNVFGARPVTFGDAHAGLRLSGGALVPFSNRAITFDGNARVTAQPGQWVESDPVACRSWKTQTTPCWLAASSPSASTWWGIAGQ
jgi:hypothetical protein